MDSTRWNSKNDLFREAYELPAAERSLYLRQRCPDASLRQEVLSLLSEETDSDMPASVDPGSVGLPAILPDLPAMGTAGTFEVQVGRYRLIEQIGEGGFGTVYLAEQTGAVRRNVALKLIKPGMDSREVIARFEQERQALALMDHPNIARVIDGGTTNSGRPYFVMELVRGVPLIEHCDTHRFTICERLELFVPICQAVQHAHQKGVIHRDLKPSNVLVSMVDGRATPKVIDFGIAKAVCGPLTDTTLLTLCQQMVGTPHYMSPEQLEGSLDIDTRSDVYSLGVLLYELLVGATPFDLRGLRSSAEMQRAIREREPATPSARLFEQTLRAGRAAGAQEAAASQPVGNSAVDIARRRRTEPATLVRQLRGEPDWIVMRALEKDRGRRYESAAAFASDIQRYLRHEPVQAGQPNLLNRIVRWARRNRGDAIAGCVVIGASAITVGGLSYGLHQAEAGRQVAEQQRDTAERAQAQSDETLAILSRLIDQLGASLHRLSATGPTQSMLDAFVAEYGAAPSANPSVDALIRRRIAEIYSGLGAWDRAYEQSLLSITSARRAWPAGNATLLPFLRDHATRANSAKVYTSALEHYGECAAILKNMFGPESIEYLEARVEMAICRANSGDPSEMEPANRALIAAAARVGQFGYCMGFGNWLCDFARRCEEAVAYHERAVAWARRQLRPIEQAHYLLAYGNALAKAGRAREAELATREALQIREAAYGTDDADIYYVYVTWGQLGWILTELGEYAEAELQLLDAYRGMNGPTSPKWEREHQPLLELTRERLKRLYELWDAAETSADHAEGASRWKSQSHSTNPTEMP